jgi:signal transduction histidine kinase
VNNLIAGLVEQAKPLLEERNQTFAVKMPAPGGTDSLPPVPTEGEDLKNAVRCLLNNAIRATPPGGNVEIHADLQEDEDGQAHILIRFVDQGGGISLSDQEAVFSPRDRNHRAAIPGLGEDPAEMAAAKSTLEFNGARIWMESEPGRGCTFSILLPVTQDAIRLPDREGTAL